MAWERTQNAIYGGDAEKFWRTHLQDCPYARFPEVYLVCRQDLRLRGEYLEFPEDSFSRFVQLAKTNKATLQMCLLAVIGTVIFKMTGQARFSLTSVLENREQGGTEGLLATLLGVMPIPFSLDASMDFESVLAQVRKNVLAAYEHKHCPWSVP